MNLCASGELMRCSKCGSDSPADKKFCEDCGAPLANRCPKCGAEVTAGKRFCGECGTALATSGATAQSSTSFFDKAEIAISAEAAVSAVAEGERKMVTALFADIKGSTELMEALDPEEARKIVDPALKLMIDAVRRYEGYVVQSTGDGIFALFGAPAAYEDHPQRGLYAALQMQQNIREYAGDLINQLKLQLEARFGINTGEVVVRTIETGGKLEYTPIGHTVNLASRLQTVAPSGSIVVSEATRRLVEGYFELRALGQMQVKGVAEPIETYEIVGAGPLRTHFELSAQRGLTKFVGRERELQQMQHALELAMSGHGQIAAVVADAGTGKSRLFYEFKAILPSHCQVLEAYSISHGKALAWLPVIELLRSYFGIQEQDEQPARREKIRVKLEALDPALSDTPPYLFGLLGIVEGADALALMDPNVKRQRTLEAIKRIILRESLVQPVVLIFEDLHWIDSQTQTLLDLLADSIISARVLLMVNYRPEYRHAWVNKSHYSQLRLEALAGDNAAAMLNALVGDSPELHPLRRMIIERTQGNPFFVEEMLQALFDEGVLTRNGVVKIARPFSQLRLPNTVQGILAARIDRQPPEHKQLLQTLAVIGRESRLDLIGQIVPIAEPQLHRMLAELGASEFIYEQPAYPQVEFVFKHALTQEVAYNSVLIERRKQLHERIGGALETLYTNALDDHLAELAHHYARANNAANAVRYLTLAGKQALERSAFSEALAQLQQGLEWIKALPESTGRDAQELELASALVPVLVATHGYSAPATVEVVERASTLAEKRGDLAQVALHQFGKWFGTFIGGDYLTAAALADQLLELAEREGSPMSLALAHDAQLQIRAFRGDLAGAEAHFIQMVSLLDAPGFAQYAGQFVSVMGIASALAFLMGQADTARQRLAQVITFARNSQNSSDAAFGLFFESWVYADLGDLRRAEAAATQSLALAEKGGFPYIGAMARCLLGRARTQLGDVGESVELIREALAGLIQTGSRVAITYYLNWLARAQALSGKIGDALDSIEEALSANPEEVIYRPHTFTTRGELWLSTGKPDLAEADFRDAIMLAQKIGAKAYELRATMSLARLFRDTGRRDEARAMLAEIYNWFTEGFDTADLKEAKALLDELSKARHGEEP